MPSISLPILFITMAEYLEKSLSCFSNSNRKGDKSDEIKKWLAREEVGQVKAGKVLGKFVKQSYLKTVN